MAIQYNSIIEKWLHYDKSLKKDVVARILGEEYLWYKSAIRAPWRHMTPSHMEKLAILAGKTLPEVFWACWVRPEHMTNGDRRRLEAISILGKIGVE